MNSWYDGADVVVLTSRSEGIPLVPMKCMARRKIVLAMTDMADRGANRWQKIAQEIAKTYFQMMGWGLAFLPASKPNASVATIVEPAGPEPRAG